jgi:heme/copper-type cytochrome/quinol oxidase subunit 2
MIRKIRLSLCLALLMLPALALQTHHALASPLYHEAPKGSEWIMADWMFLSFLIFAGVAFLAFLFALKAGWLSNLEDAKYYILEIEEEDYYTPEWAREGDEA